MTNLSMLKQMLSQNRSKLNNVLIGILIIVGGFWVYNNFTKTEDLAGKEEVKIEQSETDSQSQGVVAGDKIELGIGGGTEPTSWVANDISKDSLTNQDSYTVQSGDTLWEIAEGRYGSGFEWHKILDANKDKVGFLPDGTQALIKVGDVLNLPK